MILKIKERSFSTQNTGSLFYLSSEMTTSNTAVSKTSPVVQLDLYRFKIIADVVVTFGVWVNCVQQRVSPNPEPHVLQQQANQPLLLHGVHGQ